MLARFVKDDFSLMGLACLDCWIFILEQPRISQMEVHAVSQGSPKLLDRMRAEIRLRHYNIRTEEAYVDWARRFILFHGKRHPAEMGADEVSAFLSYLASERNVAASTQIGYGRASRLTCHAS